MKITICGSIMFYDQMLEVKKKLENLGHKVKLPPHEVPDENGKMIPVTEYYARRKASDESEKWIWERKSQAIRWHLEKINWSEAILVLNYDKKGVKNYIGGNTFLEMGVAFYLRKPIYLLNDIPQIDYREEILGMTPIIINNDLALINNHD